MTLGVLLIPSSAAPKESDGSSSLPGLVKDRTGVALPWSADVAEVAATKDTVRLLLRGDLTEEGAVRAALLNNRRLQAAFQEVGISRADYRQALLPRNPTLGGEIRFDGERRPGELAVMQDFTSILLAPLRRQAAGAAHERANLIAAEAALEVVLETRSAFYGAQGAEQIRRFWEQSVASARAAADLALRQHEAGNVSSLEIESRQALYERARIELSRSQVETLAARERLNRAMGAWGDLTIWGISDDLPEIPADTVAVAGLESMAISRRLDLAAAEAEVRSVSRTMSLARFSQFPELRAGVHFEREPEGTRSTGPAVELAFPLFDRGQHAVARARAEVRQAQDRRAALAVEIRSEVRTARDRLRAAHELAAYYRDVVLPWRARIVEQTQLEYNFMLAGVYQLLQAKQDEFNARQEHLEARRDYWIARAELEHALGGAFAAGVTK
jgi:cobalt-zinc-cadmium efflux system outer membrane protein